MPEATPDEVPWSQTVLERLPGAVLSGRFRVLSEVGHDEDSVRLVGSVVADGSPVAIDVIDLSEVLDSLPGQVSGFIDEVEAAAAAAAVRHGDVLTPRGWGWIDANAKETTRGTQARRLWVATELRAGGTLRQILDRGRRLSPSQAVVLGFHLARGLAALHDRSVVHGGLTPDTVRFGTDGRVSLAGAGWSAVVSNAVWSHSELVGVERARYGAPEFLENPQATPAGDVYALCMVLVEAVTGTVPLSGASASATMAARSGHLLPVSADLGALAPVLERAGRPEPSERPSAAAFAEALVRCAEGMARPERLPIVTDDSAGLERPALIDAAPDPDFASETPSEDAEARAASPDPETWARSVPAAETPTRITPEAPPVSEVATSAPDEVEHRSRATGRPGSRRRLVLGGLGGLAILAVLAVVVVRAFATPSHTVPELVGVPGPEVANLIGEFGWELEVVRERSDDVGDGEVIRTDPPAGVDLDEGQPFVVVISEGPTLSQLPDVLGIDGDEAVAALRAVGLSAVVTAARHDEEVPPGAVLAWFVTDQPALVAGAEVVKGTEVTLETSLGPAPREVPDVVLVEAETAVETLSGLGLVAELAEDFSDEVPIGDVAAQSPLPGELVDRGSEILVVVSKGPDVVTVPEVLGLDHEALLEALADADLVVGTVTGDTERRLLGLSVEGTAVGVGEQVPRSSVVDLVYEFPL